MLRKLIQRQATRHIGLYLFANGAKAGIPFLVMPFLTHYLLPAEYGIISVFTALLAFAVPFSAMGTTMIVGRNYHLMPREEHAQTTYTALAIMAIVTMLMTVFIGGGMFFTDEFMSLPMVLVLLIPVMCLFQNVQFLNRILLRHQQRVKLFVATEVGSTALARFGGLFAVMFISAGWVSVISAQYAAHFLFAGLAVYLLVRDKRIITRWDIARAKELLKMGWPLMPHAIGGVVMTMCDRLVLERMTDTETVGIYSIGATIGAAVLIYSTAFNNFWGPRMHRRLVSPTPETRKHIVRQTYLYYLSLLLVVPALALAGMGYVWLLVDARYHGALEVVGWIAAGTGVYSMTLAINHYLIIAAKTGALPVITAICAVANILLTIFLVERNGMVGAAQATLAAYILYFILMFWQCRRVYPMPWLPNTRETT